MFNKAGQIVDHAGSDDLVVGEWKLLQDAIFVLMPRIGERKYEPADVSLLEERQYVGERDIAIMRSLVISPADVESHSVAWHVDDGLVDCRDDALDKPEKLANWTIVVSQVPLEREIRAIEL